LIPVLRFYSSGQSCGDETDSLNNVVITSYVNFFPVVFLLFGGIIAVQCLDLIGTSDKKVFQWKYYTAWISAGTERKPTYRSLTYQRVKICDFVCPLNIAGDSVLSSKVIITTQA